MTLSTASSVGEKTTVVATGLLPTIAAAIVTPNSPHQERGPLVEEDLRDVEEFAPDRGAATAEYAIATMAAVGFAGLLVVIMRSDEVRQILTDLVRNALTFAG